MSLLSRFPSVIDVWYGMTRCLENRNGDGLSSSVRTVHTNSGKFLLLHSSSFSCQHIRQLSYPSVPTLSYTSPIVSFCPNDVPSFIQAISIAPLKVHYYSEALRHST